MVKRIDSDMKTCTKCHKAKKRSEFYRRKNSKDGLRSECITCDKKAINQYYKQNPLTEEQREHRRVYAKEYYRDNIEKCREVRRQYVQTPVGREVFRRASAKFYQLHPDKCKEAADRYEQTEAGKESRRKTNKNFKASLKGHLSSIFFGMDRRCNNPEHKTYKWYGLRGIELRFTLNEFRDYVINELGYDTIEKLRGLETHRINNDSHYMRGNIVFLTSKQHGAAHREINKLAKAVA